MATDLEHDFVAWADRQDAEALTRVFDATAGRLLLLATHVAGPKVSAEDLVQATFMTAMQRCSTWDRRRPVWPWLAAILNNHARMEWRRQRRRREVGIDQEPPLPDESPDPAAVAASDEAFESIVRAIDALSLEYRSVLRLRLVHGFSHGEIARALEIPVGTVRARTHRGLARLRETLPSGVGVGLVTAFLASEGAALAQVRQEVLAAAKSSKVALTSGASAVGVLGGVFTMKGKAMLLSAVCAAVLAIGAVIWGLSGLESIAVVPLAPAFSAVDLGLESLAQGADRELGSRRKVFDETDSPVWPLVGWVQTPHGQPIHGARVEVRVVPANNYLLPSPWSEDLTICESDESGRFECDLDSLRFRSVLFRATHVVKVQAAVGGYYPSLSSTVWLPRTIEPQEFQADLELSPGYAIVGQVIDAAGMPVSNASLSNLEEDHSFKSSTLRTTDSEGRFRVHIPSEKFASGSGLFLVTHPKQGMAEFSLPNFGQDRNVFEPIDVGTIRLNQGESIHGSVVLGDGSALADFPLVVYRIPDEVLDDPSQAFRVYFDQDQQHKPIRYASGRHFGVRVNSRTAADGSFSVGGLEPDTAYAVAVRETVVLPITATGKTGAGPIRLVVDRQFLLVDVHGESGISLPAANIEAVGFDPEWAVPADPILPGFPAQQHRVRARFYPFDAQGRRMLLSPFGWTWRIGPFDEAAQPEFVHHEALAGMHRAEIDLILKAEESFGAIRFELVDAEGERLTGDDVRSYEVQIDALDRENSRHWYFDGLKASDTLADVAAGRWIVKVHDGKFLRYEPPGRGFPRSIRSGNVHMREVLVEASETTVVRIETSKAGRVSFRLQSDSPPDKGGWPEVVLRSGGSARQLKVSILDDQPAVRGEHVVAWEAFAPGKHSFTVEVEGYLPVRCEAVVEVDRMVEVPVKLQRR